MKMEIKLLDGEKVFIMSESNKDIIEVRADNCGELRSKRVL